MFVSRVRNLFGYRVLSCVKLPAAVAFPTDERLLRRLEDLRRALPPNSVKALRTSREPLRVVAASAQHLPAVHARGAPQTALEQRAAPHFQEPAERPAAFPQLVRLDELYARGRAVLGQR
jgi:hypothetical protein